MNFQGVEREDPIVYPCLACNAPAGQSCQVSSKNKTEVEVFGYCFYRTRLSALHQCLESAKLLKLPTVHLEREIAAGPEPLYKQMEEFFKSVEDLIIIGEGSPHKIDPIVLVTS